MVLEQVKEGTRRWPKAPTTIFSAQARAPASREESRMKLFLVDKHALLAFASHSVHSGNIGIKSWLLGCVECSGVDCRGSIAGNDKGTLYPIEQSYFFLRASDTFIGYH